MGNIQADILKLHALGLLDKLLADKTTDRRILWATDAYAGLGPRYEHDREITSKLITGPSSGVIRTRAQKALEQRSERTRQQGEVFTPLSVIQKMCDYAHETWDGRVGWRQYVDRRVLEITCGEAPFLVSRYDAETGESIPILRRVGLLDRKLQTVSENAQTETDWLKWALRAFQATYAYELQGDNLLIARVNLLMTFEEYLWERWGRTPTAAEYQKLIPVIVWNVWQMDGLTMAVPCTAETVPPLCRIRRWPGKVGVVFRELPTAKMKFDLAIGNPPYQNAALGENKGFAPPVYHRFLDLTYPLADAVELIHPARFLFHAGSTPKAWNRKMLADPHLKVLYYEQRTDKVFQNTDIKGGIAITYHDTRKDFGTIGTFTAYPELDSILRKVHGHKDFSPFSAIVITRTAYRLTDTLHNDHPRAIRQLSSGHAYDMSTNIFERLPQVFFDAQPRDGQKYIQILGRKGNCRVYKYIRESYVNRVANLYKYKIYLPKANGTGTLGEALSSPVLAGPGIGSTETFLSVGAFDTLAEAQSALKYIKTKFARILLSVLKTTQDITPQKWEHVPLQDFIPASDLDWSKSISEIDRQLYAKYGLDETEIRFIETHAKEMA